MFVEWHFITGEGLTVGNAQGIGFLRERELMDSVGYFGITDVETLNHRYARPRKTADVSELQDSMTDVWPQSVIQGLVTDRIERYNINTVTAYSISLVSLHCFPRCFFAPQIPP